MADSPTAPYGNIIPALRYKDARAAIAWLGKAFGFVEHLVVPGEGEEIAHAQLAYGNGMIMLGSAREDEYGRLLATPEQAGGRNTQAPYIVVADCDAHYAQAVAAGAEVVFPIYDADHGGRAYSCKDPEGNVWNFGSYNPWTDNG